MNEEVRAVIESTHTGVLATLCEDGSPYATPITYTFDSGRFTWKSSPDAVHSKNIERDGRVSLSIVENADSKVRAVYVNNEAVATGETSFEEKWQQHLAEYAVELGTYDATHSTPGRFYFRGTNK